MKKLKPATVVLYYSDKETTEEIRADEFESFKIARAGLLKVLRLEEKFDLVIDNYIDFEQALNALALESIVHFPQSWSNMGLNLINRRLINLLSTCTLYSVYLEHLFYELYGTKEKIKNKIHNVHASSLGYRLMYEIRNYVQHRSLPLAGWNISSRVETSQIRHIVTPQISISELELDGTFRKTKQKQILDELKSKNSGGDLIDIKPYVRQSIQAIYDIQKFTRSFLETDYLNWKQLITKVIDVYGNISNRNIFYIKSPSDEGRVSILSIKNSIERYEYLRTKNHDISDLSSHYVSSETGSN